MNEDIKFLKNGSEGSDPLLPWCSGCGIGIVLNVILNALKDKKYDPSRVCIFTGIGCTGEMYKYTSIPSQSVNDGTVFASALAWMEKERSTKPIIIFNDTDLFFKDANNITAIVRSGMDALMIYVNNFLYQAIAYGKKFGNTPFDGIRIDNQIIGPENMPRILDLSGAAYIARWTVFHIRRLLYSLRDSMGYAGPSFIEIISPCLMYFSHHGDLGKKVDRMDMLKDLTEIRNDESTGNVTIKPNNKIIIGKFVDRTRASAR